MLRFRNRTRGIAGGRHIVSCLGYSFKRYHGILSFQTSRKPLVTTILYPHRLQCLPLFYNIVNRASLRHPSTIRACNRSTNTTSSPGTPEPDYTYSAYKHCLSLLLYSRPLGTRVKERCTKDSLGNLTILCVEIHRIDLVQPLPCLRACGLGFKPKFALATSFFLNTSSADFSTLNTGS